MDMSFTVAAPLLRNVLIGNIRAKSHCVLGKAMKVHLFLDPPWIFFCRLPIRTTILDCARRSNRPLMDVTIQFISFYVWVSFL